MTEQNKRTLADILSAEIAEHIPDNEVVNIGISIAINITREKNSVKNCGNCKFGIFRKYQQKGKCNLTQNNIVRQNECKHHERE